MKILITSDNHLGYKENDGIRGNDSFNTFEEILTIANSEKVDFILQGGDLFHDNRPSRYCIDRTMQLLNKYCTGTRKSKLHEIMEINSQSKSLSISIPILSIHGNHDDPSGINRISALNILHSAGYISYFGTYTEDIILVSPIIIKNVAIYGIGHIKDKILYSRFVEGKVKFNKPSNSKSLYNILILHQNRVQRNKEYIPESVLDDFFDLVIYGHEHDNNVTMGRFIVLQSGSTVRTSLCESETGDKYCYLLDIDERKDIKKQQPTLNKVKLYTVRDFIMNTVQINSDNLENEVECALEEMITKSLKDFEERKKMLVSIGVNREDTKKFKVSEDTDINITRIIEEPVLLNENLLHPNLKLPLLRLRVETNGLKIINNHKLGFKFKDRVANPSEMLRFIRKRTVSKQKSSSAPSSINIIEIIKSRLNPLSVVLEDKFMESLENFTAKEDKESFNSLITENIDRLLSKIDMSKIIVDDLEKEIARINKAEEVKSFIQTESSIIGSEDFSGYINTSDNVSKFIETKTLENTHQNEIVHNEKLNISKNNIVNSLNSNTPFLVTTSSAGVKDISYDLHENISFSSKNSKEARKMLNSIQSDSRDLIGLVSDSTAMFNNRDKTSINKDETLQRKLFVENKKPSDEYKEDCNDNSNDISSDLFDF